MNLVVGVDIETTGLDFSKGDRIIEISMLAYDLDTRKLVLDYTRRCSSGGQAIHPKAQAVHHISAADLVGLPGFEALAPKVVAIMRASKMVVTFNGESFDMPFIAHELGLAGVPIPAEVMHFDLMREGAWASYDDKFPSLKEMCWACNVEYDPAKAHAAQYDTAQMMQSYFRAIDLGLAKRPVAA